MAVLGILVGLVVAFALGKAVAGLRGALIAVLLLDTFFLFNHRQATVGLFNANLLAYWVPRAQGLSHGQAIANVITSRYPSDPAKQDQLQSHMRAFFGPYPPNSDISGSESEHVKTLVWLIFILENGLPPTEDLVKRLRARLDQQYETYARRFQTSLPRGAA